MIIENWDFFEKLENENFKIQEDEKFYYFWKKHNISSSFGTQESILSLLEEEILQEKVFIKNQKTNFTKQEEYWLLNRLDNDTAWFLYFAKNLEIYENYKKRQKNNQIQKKYIAVVKWNFPFEEKHINYEIMHKNKTKMLVLKTEKDKKLWRWRPHCVSSFVKKIKYDLTKDETYLEVWIKKWIRHQIRVHLQSINYPIIWDKLYGENRQDEVLRLYSLWFLCKILN